MNNKTYKIGEEKTISHSIKKLFKHVFPTKVDKNIKCLYWQPTKCPECGGKARHKIYRYETNHVTRVCEFCNVKFSHSRV